MELMTYAMAGTAADELEYPLMTASPDDDFDDNEDGIEDEDDLHEIQVDDDIDEPGADWGDDLDPDADLEEVELDEEEDEDAMHN